jgi:ubiquinone/menaquinone biosynthesis C-methylase UbiE
MKKNKQKVKLEISKRDYPDKNINNYDDYADDIAQSNQDGTNWAHKYIEKPAMYGSLSDVSGSSILCLGCGTGEECDYLTNLGATVTGIDASSRSIEIAKKRFASIRFEIMDMNELKYEDNSFDLVYSSLTIHYAANLEYALKEIFRVLKQGGTLVFSTLHPIKWGAEVKRDSKNERKKSFILGYDSFVQPSRVFGDYLNTREITQKPEGYPVIRYWNRSISEYLRVIKGIGFKLIDFIEPLPTDDLKNIDRDYWEIQSRIPQFMIFKLEK